MLFVFKEAGAAAGDDLSMANVVAEKEQDGLVHDGYITTTFIALSEI